MPPEIQRWGGRQMGITSSMFRMDCPFSIFHCCKETLHEPTQNPPLPQKKKKKTQTNINWKRLTAAELANTEAESSHPNEIPLNRNWKDMYAFYISSYRQNPTLYHKRETLKFSQAIAY